MAGRATDRPRRRGFLHDEGHLYVSHTLHRTAAALCVSAAISTIESVHPTAAAVPFPLYSSVDSVLVGGPSGSLPEGGFLVIPRSVGGVPLSGKQVTLHFSDPALVLAEDQEPGTLVLCAERTLMRYSGPDGVTIFHPRFGGYLNSQEFEVRAGGALLRRIPVRSTDIDGDGITGLSDLALFSQNLFHAPFAPETDYTLDGVTGLGDLEVLRREIYAAGSGVLCP